MFTVELTALVRSITSFERPDASIQVSGDADAVRESGDWGDADTRNFVPDDGVCRQDDT